MEASNKKRKTGNIKNGNRRKTWNKNEVYSKFHVQFKV